ncbi:MAG: hypothetical protein Q4G59_06960, partial [Planctomycetia bacterium]|nr:hypothetical protein [Planctomycetia bacterium]
NISDYMGKAGFTQSESNDYHILASEASQLNKLVKNKSGDYFDPRDFDPNMRALLDRFITASEAEVVVDATADFSFLDLIDDSTDSNATIENTIEQSGGNEKAAAEIIEGKARAVINSFKDKDPELYKTFSSRLQSLLDAIKKSSSDYKERMNQIISFIKSTKSNRFGYPQEITTELAKSLWNNRTSWCDSSDETEVVRKVEKIGEIMDYDAQDGWKNQSSPKYDAVMNAFKKVLPQATEEQLYNLYTLAAQNCR